jgi:hypothetical protein
MWPCLFDASEVCCGKERGMRLRLQERHGAYGYMHDSCMGKRFRCCISGWYRWRNDCSCRGYRCCCRCCCHFPCRFSCTPNPPTQFLLPRIICVLIWTSCQGIVHQRSTLEQWSASLYPFDSSELSASIFRSEYPNSNWWGLHNLRCEQGPVITEIHSRVVIMNNTSGGTLIQGITINNPQGDVHFMPGGIWIWTSSADNTIIGRCNPNTISRLRHWRCWILVLFIFSNELVDVTQLWYFPSG